MFPIRNAIDNVKAIQIVITNKFWTCIIDLDDLILVWNNQWTTQNYSCLRACLYDELRETTDEMKWLIVGRRFQNLVFSLFSFLG